MGAYLSFEAMLSRILAYEDLKPEVFQCMREIGNTFALMYLLQDSISRLDLHRHVLAAPFLQPPASSQQAGGAVGCRVSWAGSRTQPAAVPLSTDVVESTLLFREAMALENLSGLQDLPKDELSRSAVLTGSTKLASQRPAAVPGSASEPKARLVSSLVGGGLSNVAFRTADVYVRYGESTVLFGDCLQHVSEVLMQPRTYLAQTSNRNTCASMLAHILGPHSHASPLLTQILVARCVLWCRDGLQKLPTCHYGPSGTATRRPTPRQPSGSSPSQAVLAEMYAFSSHQFINVR